MELLQNALGYVCSHCRNTFASLTNQAHSADGGRGDVPGRSRIYRSALGHISKSAKCRAAGAQLLLIDIPFRASDVRVGGSGSDRQPRDDDRSAGKAVNAIIYIKGT